MFVITDQNSVVVDLASREENLSRGYGFPNHTVFELPKLDMTIGDTYKDGRLTRNIENRVRIAQRRSDEAKITRRMRQIAISDLKDKGELPGDYE